MISFFPGGDDKVYLILYSVGFSLIYFKISLYLYRFSLYFISAISIFLWRFVLYL